MDMTLSLLRMRYFYLFLCAGLLTCWSCGSDTNKQAAPVADTLAPDSASDPMYESARSLFFSMPSPLELTSLIKSAGGKFELELLHDPNKASAYQTVQKQALVLGVYGADLSYASVFDRQQEAVKYLAASKRVGETIGIHEAFSAGIVERANKNLDNRDSMLNIMTEMYWQMNSQLKEESRDKVSLLVLAGGWAEGLYIGMQLLDRENPDPEIATRLIEQKHTAMQLDQMFSDYNEDAMVSSTHEMFLPTFNFFAGLDIQEEETEVSTNDEGVVTIGGKKTIRYTDDDLNTLRELSAEMRSKMITP